MRQIALALLAGMTSPLMAQDIFPAGSENKARGIESMVASERGSAVLYNPSNLTTTPGRRAYLEAGFINVNYAYEHPQYDPVIIKTNSPLAALGYGGVLANKWYVGAMIMPTKGGEMDVPGVPRDVAGVVVPVAVRNKDLALKSGLGAAYRINDQWRLGVSLLHQFEHRELSANVVGNPIEVLNYDIYHQSLQPKLGMRYANDWITVGAAFSPAQTKTYSGSFTSAANPDSTGVPVKDYIPMQTGLGIAIRKSAVAVEINLIHEAWQGGQSIVSSGQSNAAIADLSNTLNWGTSLSYDTGRKLKFIAGYADRPSPWGAGQNDPSEEMSTGADFGVLNGIDRKNFSAGTQMVLSPETRLETAFYHSSGERENQSSTASATGRLQIAITAVTATLSQQF
jgi:hypothetical protein